MSILILGSGSPRRRSYLEQLGVAFQVVSPDIDESVLPGEAPADYVQRIALEKNKSVVEQVSRMALVHDAVLTADTTVELDGVILGKPENRADAHRMLSLMSGRGHHVFSALALSLPGRGECEVRLVKTAVYFRKLTETEISRYLKSSEPYDKAGGYAVQGGAVSMVSRIEGSYTNIVGLPLSELVEMLRCHGLIDG